MWPILEGTASSLFVLETKRNPTQTDSLFVLKLCMKKKREIHGLTFTKPVIMHVCT